MIIAIDGPSGSGKSTIARTLAEQRNWAYLDTGAMYRAATWYLLQHGIDLDDQTAVAKAVASMDLVMVTDATDPRFIAAGTDVTEVVHSAEISRVVSKVATNLAVRATMKSWQQAIIAAHADPGIVAEGRDITTVVAPNADVRILLTASTQARLARRAKQRHGHANAATLAATTDEVVRRDQQDGTVSNFTTAANGVVTIDSSTLTIAQTLAAVSAEIAKVQQ
ncbi:MAG: (d)CMP kinase [Bowdeniella nasicola]|nr:(d)CMP kinase [Bowdeniella nasicola]